MIIIKSYFLRNSLLVTLLIGAFNFTVQAQSERQNLKREIEKIIYNDTNITDGPVSKLVVSVIDGDSIFTVGISLNRKIKAVDTDAVYELGSVSKSLTASLIHILADQDYLKLTDPINRYIPNIYQNPRCEDLTVENLLNHHTPLPRRPSYFGKISKNVNDPYADYDRSHLLKFYRDFVPANNSSEFKYSHTNYALLEIISEMATGFSFSEACNKFLFEPLEMNASIIGNQENLSTSIAEGYDRADRIASPWYFQSFIASEGIRSNANDLAKFLQSQMLCNSAEIDPILQNMHEIKGNTNLGKDLAISNGWFVVKRKKKYDILTMTGHTTGHRAELAFIPETKTGVVLLSNCNSGAEDLAILILRMINDNWKRKI